jgi:hypothetical protein
MKRICLIILFFSVFALVSCELLKPKPEANFTITDWKQEYNELLEEWDWVYINYLAENTGKVDIDYFEVYFKVECADDSIYYGSDFHFGLSRDAKRNYTTYVDTAGKQALSVIISDYDLTVY